MMVMRMVCAHCGASHQVSVLQGSYRELPCRSCGQAMPIQGGARRSFLEPLQPLRPYDESESIDTEVQRPPASLRLAAPSTSAPADLEEASRTISMASSPALALEPYGDAAPERRLDTAERCRHCQGAIRPGARKCKHCRRWLEGRTGTAPAPDLWSPDRAAADARPWLAACLLAATAALVALLVLFPGRERLPFLERGADRSAPVSVPADGQTTAGRR
jgi:hypothetical protein